jgi:hypothetical protein
MILNVFWFFCCDATLMIRFTRQVTFAKEGKMGAQTFRGSLIAC